MIGFNNWFNVAYPNEPPLAIRWGGDWDLDGVTTDQTFMDLAHFEIVNLL